MGAVEQEKKSEIQSVRELLRDWARWTRRWRPSLNSLSSVPYLDNMLPTIDSYAEGEDYDEEINAVVMLAVDHAVERDLTRPQSIAIRMTYMNEIGPAVWRSNRIPVEQVKVLCQEAEFALIPALLRRNVRL